MMFATASGFLVESSLEDSSLSARPYPTSLIVHPRFPFGAKHFLHPSRLLRSSVSLGVPGIPFELVVRQRQSSKTGDGTGFSVWRGSTLLAAFLAKHHRYSSGSAIELGCGSGAIVSAVAAFCGFDAHATDGCPEVVEDARQSITEHRVAALRAGQSLRGRLSCGALEWRPDLAKRLNRRFDLVLGSEVVYALPTDSQDTITANFKNLAATIDILLKPYGLCVLAWNPRTDAEHNFFRIIRDFNLVASKPHALDGLGLTADQTGGLRLVTLSRPRTITTTEEGSDHHRSTQTHLKN